MLPCRCFEGQFPLSKGFGVKQAHFSVLFNILATQFMGIVQWLVFGFLKCEMICSAAKSHLIEPLVEQLPTVVKRNSRWEARLPLLDLWSFACNSVFLSLSLLTKNGNGSCLTKGANTHEANYVSYWICGLFSRPSDVVLELIDMQGEQICSHRITLNCVISNHPIWRQFVFIGIVLVFNLVEFSG